MPVKRDISVYVCTYGDLTAKNRDIKRCIFCIKASDIPYSSISVMAGSVSRELKIFCKTEGVTILRQRKNKPLGFHRSECIKDCKTRWLMFVDDDVYIERDWYHKIEPTLTKNVAVVHGIKKFEMRSQNDFINQAANSIFLAKLYRNMLLKKLPYCTFENTLIDTGIFVALGIDRMMSQYHSYEDWTAYFALCQSTYRWVCVPTVIVKHNGLTFSELMKKHSWYAAGKNAKPRYYRVLVNTAIDMGILLALCFYDMIIRALAIAFVPIVYLCIRAFCTCSRR